MNAAIAASDPLLGWLIVLALAVVGLVWHAVACALWPFRTCPRCNGTGKRVSPSGKRFGLCRRCGGSARRLRFGRVVWNYFRRSRDRAS